MVSKSHAKRRQDIKTKLMAAIAMLLVSSIMMVSSTYAWFTLSTAPEVTGISTQVGANGNLEMMLQPLNGESDKVSSAVGDSTKDVYARNTTWGNIVDLSSTTYYGLDKIVLNPASLNVTGTKIDTNPLAIPEYGSDGRITILNKTKTITGVYNATESKFLEDATVGTGDEAETVENAKGVRAIGVSSGMSDRQLAYRAAVSAAATAGTQAKTVASKSLNTNGAKLANIAIKHATSDTTETYTGADIEVLLLMTQELLGTEGKTGSLEYIEKALIQYALASELAVDSDDDAAAKTVEDYKAITTVAGLASRTHNNTAVTTAVGKLTATIEKVQSAQDALNGLLTGENETKNSYVWSDFSSALTELANPNAMQINGIVVDDIKGNWKSDIDPDGDEEQYKIVDGVVHELDTDTNKYAPVKNMSRIVDSVLNGGINLIIASGAGVYADISDHCGDYSAQVTLEKLSYGGMIVKNLDATMSTDTDLAPDTYLEQAIDGMPDYDAGTGGSATTAITDFYGYVIDLAFRTNASGSNLELWQEGGDRIYNGNTANDETLGQGAFMEYKAVSAQFTGAQVKSLMSKIRIVFFNTDDNEIIGYARLDSSAATTETDGTTRMPIYMCDAAGAQKKDADGDNDNTIMALEQNTVHELSVMVYLDGEAVTNADVAFNDALSMQGSMNLQFKSSATLVPMEYTDLRTGTGEVTPATPTVTDVTTGTITEGYSATLKYVAGHGIGAIITETTGNSVVSNGVTVKIGDSTATYTEIPNVGSYWIVDADTAPTGAVNVTVTAN